jgi:hypothetical protein
MVQSNKQQSMYKILYGSESNKKMFQFSIFRVLTYPEAQRLFIFNVLMFINMIITITLDMPERARQDIDDDNPPDEKPF